MNTAARLPRLTIGFHWVIALLMIGNLISGMVLEEMERSPDKSQLGGLHKSVGALILVLAVLRILHTLKQGLPQPLTPAAQWQLNMARWIHLLLLAGTVLMPISGMTMTLAAGHPLPFFDFELIAGSGEKIEWLSKLGHAIHGGGANLIILALLLHIAAAVKHSVIDKDGTMQRILGRS